MGHLSNYIHVHTCDSDLCSFQCIYPKGIRLLTVLKKKKKKKLRLIFTRNQHLAICFSKKSNTQALHYEYENSTEQELQDKQTTKTSVYSLMVNNNLKWLRFAVHAGGLYWLCKPLNRRQLQLYIRQQCRLCGLKQTNVNICVVWVCILISEQNTMLLIWVEFCNSNKPC